MVGLSNNGPHLDVSFSGSLNGVGSGTTNPGGIFDLPGVDSGFGASRNGFWIKRGATVYFENAIVSVSGSAFPAGLDAVKSDQVISTVRHPRPPGSFGVFPKRRASNWAHIPSLLFLPASYTLGEPISGYSFQVQNTNLDDLGWILGTEVTYTTSIGGVMDDIVIQAVPSAVPEPSSFLLGMGTLLVAFMWRRRAAGRNVYSGCCAGDGPR